MNIIRICSVFAFILSLPCLVEAAIPSRIDFAGRYACEIDETSSVLVRRLPNGSTLEAPFASVLKRERRAVGVSRSLRRVLLSSLEGIGNSSRRKKLLGRIRKENTKLRHSKITLRWLRRCKKGTLPPALCFTSLTGSGTSNDGGGIYQITDGNIYFDTDDFGLRLRLALQITSQAGGPGWVDVVAGPPQPGDDENERTYKVLQGRQQVIPEGEEEKVTGTVTVDQSNLPLVSVLLHLIHNGQAAQYQATWNLAAYNGTGDYNGDGVTDLTDAKKFLACFTGISAAVLILKPSCVVTDSDMNGRVDFADALLFAAAVSSVFTK